MILSFHSRWHRPPPSTTRLVPPFAILALVVLSRLSPCSSAHAHRHAPFGRTALHHLQRHLFLRHHHPRPAQHHSARITPLRTNARQEAQTHQYEDHDGRSVLKHHCTTRPHTAVKVDSYFVATSRSSPDDHYLSRFLHSRCSSSTKTPSASPLDAISFSARRPLIRRWISSQEFTAGSRRAEESGPHVTERNKAASDFSAV
ncbi:hypothetical protein K438DRAFT_1846055 [Mycena galopus ATCC 62051]|nr:hypothetical protein K438DRAFT_1846055 [Mycena galopus ATCC 62051]